MGTSQIMQGTGDFHDVVGDAVSMKAQRVFDDTAAFDSGQGVFNGHPHTAYDAVEQLGGDTQRSSSSLFWGCRVNTPAGS